MKGDESANAVSSASTRAIKHIKRPLLKTDFSSGALTDEEKEALSLIEEDKSRQEKYKLFKNIETQLDIYERKELQHLIEENTKDRLESLLKDIAGVVETEASNKYNNPEITSKVMQNNIAKQYEIPLTLVETLVDIKKRIN